MNRIIYSFLHRPVSLHYAGTPESSYFRFVQHTLGPRTIECYVCNRNTHTAHTHNPVRYFKMNFGCILAFKVSCRLFLTLFNIRSTSTKSSHRHVKDVKHYIMKMVRRKQRVFYIPRQENNIHKYLYCTNWTNKKKTNEFRWKTIEGKWKL